MTTSVHRIDPKYDKKKKALLSFPILVEMLFTGGENERTSLRADT